MKKTLLIIFGAALFLLILWAGYFYWNNLRGVGPALKKPAEDIAEIIEKAVRRTPDSSGEKEVAMPKADLPLAKPDEHDDGSIPQLEVVDFPLILEEGFSISIFAKDLGKPRVMVRDPEGNLIVSITKSNKVVALPDRDNDGAADEIVTVIDNLNRPHGMAFKCDPGCRLYIAETDQLAVYDYDQTNLKALNKQKLTDLPDGGRHFTRTLLFRPPPDDDQLLVSIGSSCDTCYESDERRAAIWVLDLKDNSFKAFAKGLRNAVFMANHPVIDELWVTEMGRDHLGDDLPPDEINFVEEGKNYGWPICYGKNVHDTVFDKNNQTNPCVEPLIMPSYIDIPAHSSPLGLAFFPQVGWPDDYQNNLLVAYHGSWNRTIPTGYKIVRYKLDRKGNYLGEKDFITGWLRADGTSLGRPVDTLIEPNGEIYISDDKAGVIYRVVYKEVIKKRRFVPEPKPISGCVVSGCSSEICAEEEVISICLFRPEYECYRTATCERQLDGECGWTMTDELIDCVQDLSKKS